MTDIKNLSAYDFEQMLIKQAENQGAGAPLDVHSAMFRYFSPRFKGQVNWTSKKQILLLMQDLAGNENNSDSDVNKILSVGNKLNINALKRVLFSVIDFPLENDNPRLLNDSEKKLFELLTSLFLNKYYTCIKNGLEMGQKDSKVKLEFSDFIKHKLDINSEEFKKREKFEKDGFITGNQLLTSKFLLVSAVQEELELKQELLKNEKISD